MMNCSIDQIIKRNVVDETGAEVEGLSVTVCFTETQLINLLSGLTTIDAEIIQTLNDYVGAG